MRSLCFFLLLCCCHANAFFSLQAKPDLQAFANFDPQHLCDTAKNTLAYRVTQSHDSQVIHPGLLAKSGVTNQDIENTLRFICEVYQHDSQNEQQSRLSDPRFLIEHFDFYKWSPDIETAQKFAKRKTLVNGLSPETILMTKYYVHKATGSLIPTAQQPYAIFGLPFDEVGLSPQQADSKQTELTRFNYTKQDALEGKLTNKAPALAYLSRENLEAALMQGTIVVSLQGQQRTFNVHRSNEIPYDRNVAPYLQKRYWYFKEVDGIKGYGIDANHKITVNERVTFAADLFQLGLGQLLLAKMSVNNQTEFRLGVLADTGGAFHDNLYQVDYLAGSYQGLDEYRKANKHLPDYIEAWLLIKKKNND